jgi:ATP-dependent RNA helicase DDX52/ROK1
MAIRNLFKEGFEPPILVFVETKERAQQLFKELIYDNIYVDIISSDRTQQQVRLKTKKVKLKRFTII